MNEITTEYKQAYDLHLKILNSARSAQESLYEMCIGFKQMRDSKLYKELGYSDFGDYCEQATSFKRSQVYNYISIAEKLPADFVQTIGQAAGMSKMLLLSSLSEEEREKVVEKTDIKKVSVRGLQDKIEELKSKNQRLMYELDAESEKTKLAEKEGKKATERLSILKTDKEMAEKKVAELEQKLKELKDKPAEVVQTVEVIPPGYVLASDLVEEEKRVEEEKAKLEGEIAELKKQLAEAESAEPEKVTVPDTDGVFKAYMTSAYTAFNELVKFVQEHSEYIPKVNALIENVKKSVGAV